MDRVWSESAANPADQDSPLFGSSLASQSGEEADAEEELDESRSQLSKQVGTFEIAAPGTSAIQSEDSAPGFLCGMPLPESPTDSRPTDPLLSTPILVAQARSVSQSGPSQPSQRDRTIRERDEFTAKSTLSGAPWSHKYLTLAGGVLIQLSLGSIYSFGNLLPYLASYLAYHRSDSRSDESLQNKYEHYESALLWAFALVLVGQSVLFPVGGMLEQRYGTRLTALFGCSVSSVFGTALNFFTLRFAASKFSLSWLSLACFMLSSGLLFGCGIGLAYPAVMVASMKWFPHHQGFANGMIVAGFGAGALIFDSVQTAFINPGNIEVDEDLGFTRDRGVLNRLPKLYLILALIFIVMQVTGLLLIRVVPPDNTPPQLSNYQGIIDSRNGPEMKKPSHLTSMHSNNHITGSKRTMFDIVPLGFSPVERGSRKVTFEKLKSPVENDPVQSSETPLLMRQTGMTTSKSSEDTTSTPMTSTLMSESFDTEDLYFDGYTEEDSQTTGSGTTGAGASSSASTKKGRRTVFDFLTNRTSSRRLAKTNGGGGNVAQQRKFNSLLRRAAMQQSESDDASSSLLERRHSAPEAQGLVLYTKTSSVHSADTRRSSLTESQYYEVMDGVRLRRESRGVTWVDRQIKGPLTFMSSDLLGGDMQRRQSYYQNGVIDKSDSLKSDPGNGDPFASLARGNKKGLLASPETRMQTIPDEGSEDEMSSLGVRENTMRSAWLSVGTAISNSMPIPRSKRTATPQSLVDRVSDHRRGLVSLSVENRPQMSRDEVWRVVRYSRDFWILNSTFFLNTVMMVFISTQWKVFGTEYCSMGDDTRLSYIGSISAIFNGFGRLFWGVLLDRINAQLRAMELGLPLNHEGYHPTLHSIPDEEVAPDRSVFGTQQQQQHQQQPLSHPHSAYHAAVHGGPAVVVAADSSIRRLLPATSLAAIHASDYQLLDSPPKEDAPRNGSGKDSLLPRTLSGRRSSRVRASDVREGTPLMLKDRSPGVRRHEWFRRGHRIVMGMLLMVWTVSTGSMSLIRQSSPLKYEVFGVYVCLMFFCLGGMFSVYPSTVSMLWGKRNAGVVYGLCFAFSALSNVFAIFVFGYVRDGMGWAASTVFISLFGACSLGLTLCFF